MALRKWHKTVHDRWFSVAYFSLSFFMFRSPSATQGIEDGAHGYLIFFLPSDSHFLAAFSVFTKRKAGVLVGGWLGRTAVVWSGWLAVFQGELRAWLVVYERNLGGWLAC